MKKGLGNKRGLSILLIVIISVLVIIVLFGIFYFNNLSSNKSINTNTNPNVAIQKQSVNNQEEVKAETGTSSVLNNKNIAGNSNGGKLGSGKIPIVTSSSGGGASGGNTGQGTNNLVAATDNSVCTQSQINEIIDKIKKLYIDVPPCPCEGTPPEKNSCGTGKWYYDTFTTDCYADGRFYVLVESNMPVPEGNDNQCGYDTVGLNGIQFLPQQKDQGACGTSTCGAMYFARNTFDPNDMNVFTNNYGTNTYYFWYVASSTFARGGAYAKITSVSFMPNVCTTEMKGTLCRPADPSKPCDVPEYWDNDCKCPPDGFAGDSIICRRAKNDLCDLDESCNGESPDCPADVFKPSGTLCKAADNDCKLDALCDGKGNCPTNQNKPDGTECKIDQDKSGYCQSGECVPYECERDDNCGEHGWGPKYCDGNTVKHYPIFCDTVKTHRCIQGHYPITVEDCGPKYKITMEFCSSHLELYKPFDGYNMCFEDPGDSIILPAKYCLTYSLGGIKYYTYSGAYYIAYDKNTCENGECEKDSISHTKECTTYHSIAFNYFDNKPTDSCNGNLCRGDCWSNADCNGGFCIGGQTAPDNEPYPGTCLIDPEDIPNYIYFADCEGTGSHANDPPVSCSTDLQVCASDLPSGSIENCHAVSNYNDLGCKNIKDPNLFASTCMECTPVTDNIPPACINLGGVVGDPANNPISSSTTSIYFIRERKNPVLDGLAYVITPHVDFNKNINITMNYSYYSNLMDPVTYKYMDYKSVLKQCNVTDILGNVTSGIDSNGGSVNLGDKIKLDVPGGAYNDSLNITIQEYNLGECNEFNFNSDSNNSCTDTDNGLNYFARGNTYDGVSNENDYCLNNTALREYYCNGSVSYIDYNCQNICMDGACYLFGDSNMDGYVNGADLNTVLSNYNQDFGAGDWWSKGDFNNDGIVNGADLNTVFSNYGQSVYGGLAEIKPNVVFYIVVIIIIIFFIIAYIIIKNRKRNKIIRKRRR